VDTSRVSNGSTVSEQANGHVALTDSHTDARDPDVLILPPEVEQELNESDESLGSLGRPLDRRSPFFVGLTGALGVGVAYILFRGLADVTIPPTLRQSTI
jgi:hypothetical protein